MKTLDRSITRRRFLARLGVATIGLGAASAWTPRRAVAGPAERPNILFLMSDQHRWDFMGCCGHPVVQTPNLDRLASQGTRCNAAYCESPLCVPSRMSIITGRYVHSHGALGNTHELPADQQTIGHYLKSLGYQTGAIGKMHFVGQDNQHGFEYRIERPDYEAALAGQAKARPDRSREGAQWGISSQTEEQTYEHYLADKTIQWLENNGSRPFCLWCSLIAPHPPFVAPEKLYQLYAGKVKLPPQPPADNPLAARHRERWADLDEKDALTIMTAYLARITLVDMNLGRVLQTLQRLGLAQNTIVSYTADHGDMEYEHKLFGKSVMFDGATRIPYILRYPGRVPQGAVRQEVVEHVDLYPTFCDLAGVPVPKTIQGRSLLPLLQGSDPAWPNTAFSELGDVVMVRSGQYKCNFYGGRPLELYDMQKDPREFHNLAGSSQGEKTIAEMTKIRDEWMARTQPDLRNQVKPLRAGRQQRKGFPGAGKAKKEAKTRQ